MEILILQVFVSLLLVTGGVLLFAWSIKQADHEHADRLALFPIEPDGDEVRAVKRAGSESSAKTAAPAGGAL